MSDFTKKLSALLNSESRDNEANTPDYILAMYMASCLAAFTTAVQQRDTHDGRDARPRAPRVIECVFSVEPTAEHALHTGRRRYRVACNTCNELLHEATTGTDARIEEHLRRNAIAVPPPGVTPRRG